MSARRYFDVPKNYENYREEQIQTFLRRNPPPKRPREVPLDEYGNYLQKWFGNLPSDEVDEIDHHPDYPVYKRDRETRDYLRRLETPEGRTELIKVYPTLTQYFTMNVRQDREKAIDEIMNANAARLEMPRRHVKKQK